MARGKQNRQY